jgi:hypothetical protein
MLRPMLAAIIRSDDAVLVFSVYGKRPDDGLVLAETRSLLYLLLCVLLISKIHLSNVFV